MPIAYKVRRRVVGDIKIMFYSNDELILVRGDQATIFHAWFEKNRKYTFRPFAKRLVKQKDLTYSKVFEIAERFNISHISDNYGKHKTLIVEVELPSKGESRNKEFAL